MTTLTINGESRTVESPPDTPLLWVLRAELNLTGTKFGCGRALCGACTVLLDGAAVRSCVLPLAAVGTAHVMTIEGPESRELAALRSAWSELDVAQCGYCQSGQLMSAAPISAFAPPFTEPLKHSRADPVSIALTSSQARLGQATPGQARPGQARLG